MSLTRADLRMLACRGIIGHRWDWPVPWSPVWRLLNVRPPPTVVMCSRCGAGFAFQAWPRHDRPVVT